MLILLREDIRPESVIYQDILQQPVQQGRQEGEVQLILRLLARRFGEIYPQLQQRVRSLSIEQLESLGEMLLDVSYSRELSKLAKSARAIG